MVKKISLILSLAISLSFYTACRSETISEGSDKNKIVEKILELSGAKKQIESFPSIVEAGIAEQKNRHDPQTFEIVKKAISESYQAKAMYQVVFDNLVANFDRNRYSALLNWLHSPLSRKMSQLEEQASTAEAMREMREFAATLQSNPPAQERMVLVQELDQTVRATELTIEIISSTNLQMLKAFEAALPQEQRIKEENWEEKFKANISAQLAEPMRQTTLLSLLYTYRSASDEDLRKYIDFWKSSDGQWSNKVLSHALLSALAKAGGEVGNRLAKSLPSKEKPDK